VDQHQITSIKHEKIVFARLLQQRKYRLESRHALVQGWEQIRWACDSLCTLNYLLVHYKVSREEIAALAPGNQAPIYWCSDGVLKKVTQTNYLIPAVAVIAMSDSKHPLADELLVVFDGVHDFGNIGTIVRTASAFGVQQFAATASDFDLFQRKTIDASRGTVLSARCDNFENPTVALRSLKDDGYQIVATALEGSKLQSLATLANKPVAIVFGNESSGVSHDVLKQADLCIQIPMATQLDSLNVGVAAGITLYELQLKMVLMMLNKKINGSLGRNLHTTSRWLRRLFDVKLRSVADLSADQAIVLMILACDSEGERDVLLDMAGIDSTTGPALFTPLIAAGYLDAKEGDRVVSTEKGKELLGKIWNVHEKVENMALKDFSSEERAQLARLLARMQHNLGKEVTYEP
jgi:TrmH family RNA methyltransferase